MKKIKLFSLVAAALFAGSTMAADQVVFHWQMSGTDVPTAGTALTATGGTITANTTDGSKKFDVESVQYNANVTDADMKATGEKGLKLGSNALYLEVVGDFQSGDIVYICGYNTIKVSKSTTFGGEYAASISTGTSKSDYQVGSFSLNADATTLIFHRATGSSTAVAAIKIVRPSSEPECPSGLTITGDEQLYAGDKMTLTATLSAGNGEIAYQWYKDGTAAENAIDGATNKSYVVESFSAADAGSYFCQASKADCEATINAEAFVVALKEVLAITCDSDKYIPKAGDKVEDKMTVTTPSVKLTLGTGGWAEVKDDSAPKGYGALIAGSANPTLSGVIPTAGCFYKFEVSKNATLNVAIKINSGKSLFVIKGTESVGYNLADSAYNAGSKISTGMREVLSFPVEPETPYYLYCSGSKLGIFGFEIPGEDGPSTAMEQAPIEVKAVKVIRNGQLLIIRDGKTYTAQGVELR